jgi:hypothetical protein
MKIIQHGGTMDTRLSGMKKFSGECLGKQEILKNGLNKMCC